MIFNVIVLQQEEQRNYSSFAFVELEIPDKAELTEWGDIQLFKLVCRNIRLIIDILFLILIYFVDSDQNTKVVSGYSENNSTQKDLNLDKRIGGLKVLLFKEYDL